MSPVSLLYAGYSGFVKLFMVVFSWITVKRFSRFVCFIFINAYVGVMENLKSGSLIKVQIVGRLASLFATQSPRWVDFAATRRCKIDPSMIK